MCTYRWLANHQWAYQVGESVGVRGIGELTTHDPQHADLLTDAALVIQEGRIAWIGPQGELPATDQLIDVHGAAVIPGFVDSHAHPIFAGDRAREFAARMAGQPYAAGGIRSTVALTRAATDDELRSNLTRLHAEFLRSGITTFEAKSGYGLTVADEARSLRIASEQTAETTFLGAHVIPQEFESDPAGYVALVIGPMLQACAPYSRWIDVFCDRGAFDGEQARAILQAGAQQGLGLRIHANQLQPGPGVQIAVELGAASADHCTHLSAADIDALASSDTVATLVPGAEFSTRSPYPNARTLIDAGADVALATDCNPGSSYTTSMAFCIAIAVREMQMTPAEAVRSATLHGAKALRRDDVGHLRPGASADFIVLDAPSAIHLAYRPGVDCIDRVYRQGTLVHERSAG